MNEQLEFDLVSPWLAEPAVCADLREVSRYHAELSNALQQRATLEARLSHEDLVYGPVTEAELMEARTIFGARWKAVQKVWERRAKKNPRRFRKTLLTIKSLLDL